LLKMVFPYRQAILLPRRLKIKTVPKQTTNLIKMGNSLSIAKDTGDRSWIPCSREYIISIRTYLILRWRGSRGPSRICGSHQVQRGVGVGEDTRRPDHTTGEGKLGGPIHEDVEKILITDKYTRGIWREPIAPGKYNLNAIAFTAYQVPTSAVTIDWASEGRIGTEVKELSHQRLRPRGSYTVLIP